MSNYDVYFTIFSKIIHAISRNYFHDLMILWNVGSNYYKIQVLEFLSKMFWPDYLSVFKVI